MGSEACNAFLSLRFYLMKFAKGTLQRKIYCVNSFLYAKKGDKKICGGLVVEIRTKISTF